jgi:hypothetical protein
VGNNPVEKLQAIISDYSENMFYQGQELAKKWEIKYPYGGLPAFSFWGETNGFLEMEDNTHDWYDDGSEQPVGYTLDPGGFNSAEADKVSAAYLKFNLGVKQIYEATGANHYEIRQKQLEIIQSNLIPLALDILGAVATSYSINYDGASGKLILPDKTHTCKDVRTDSVECRLYLDGKLRAYDDAPPAIQLALEEFNYALNDAHAEISKTNELTHKENIYARIASEIRELIIEYCFDLYRKRQTHSIGAGALRDTQESLSGFATS